MNRSWRSRGCSPLTVWAGSDLLIKFKEHTGKFLPQPVPEFHRLLGLMISNGIGPLNKIEFDFLLRSILPLEEDQKKLKKTDTERIITASAIIVEYSLAGFDRSKNYLAKIEAYTMLFCYICALALKLRLQKRSWEPTARLIERAIDTCAQQLSEETELLGGFGQDNPFTEPIVAPYRKALLTGAIAAHGLWCMLGGKSEWYHEKRDTVIKNVLNCSQKTTLPAESFVPTLFLASEYLRHNGHIVPGNTIFVELLKHCILRKQANRSLRPLWGPYPPIEEVILRDLGKAQSDMIEEKPNLTTYTTHALILIAASRLLRQDLESLWYSITSLHLSEFVANKAWHMLLWRNKKGVLIQKMVPRPQSWQDLCKEANNRPKMPRFFAKMVHWLPYYLMVYPHRFSPGPVLALDIALNNVAR
jgi:hypothetical protein